MNLLSLVKRFVDSLMLFLCVYIFFIDMYKIEVLKLILICLWAFILCNWGVEKLYTVKYRFYITILITFSFGMLVFIIFSLTKFIILSRITFLISASMFFLSRLYILNQEKIAKQNKENK